MAGLVPAIHVLQHRRMELATFILSRRLGDVLMILSRSGACVTRKKDVDGRDKPGRDEE
jgi:hypothetical protein